MGRDPFVVLCFFMSFLVDDFSFLALFPPAPHFLLSIEEM